MRRCFDLLKTHKNMPLNIASVPQDDKATYDMICMAGYGRCLSIESPRTDEYAAAYQA